MKTHTVRWLRWCVAGAVVAVVMGTAAVAQAEWALTPEVQLTTNDKPQWYPDVSGDWVVFEDQRNPVTYDAGDYQGELYEVRAINLRTGAEVKITSTAMGEPAVAGDYVVWPDNGNGTTTRGIWYHNLKTGTHKRLPVKKGNSVEISGHRLVYAYGGDIYTYNLWSGSHVRITSNHLSYGPDISGTKVVWAHSPNAAEADIYCYDILTGTTKRLTSVASDDVHSPAIDGNTVVWVDDRNENDDVYSYDLATKTERRITFGMLQEMHPAVSGSWIVWQDGRTTHDQIYLYDLVTNTEHRMTNNSFNQKYAAISGDRIVYMDDRNGASNSDLFMTRVAVPLLTLSAPGTVGSSVPATVTGTLLSASGAALPGIIVELEASTDKKTWTNCDSTTTVAGGAFTMHSPAFTTKRYLRARYNGWSTAAAPSGYDYPPATSATKLVKATVGFTGAPRFKTYTHRFGTTYKAWGYFKPEHATGSTQMRLKAYRWNGSVWVYKRSYTTRVSNPSGSAYSEFTGYVRLPSKGSWRLRIYHAEDSKNAKTHGPYRYVTVK